MLTTREAAKYLGISIYYLRNMRHLLHTHDGPECIQVLHPRGIAYQYAIEALDSWKSSHNWRSKNDNS